MNKSTLPIISGGTLTRETLRGRVAVVSGAGAGIGYEAARSLVWLGAHVVIAELDRRLGRKAERQLWEEMGEGCATFIHTDVGDERSLARMTARLVNDIGQADIVINNAAVVPVGAVHETRIQDWDGSYRTNVRGPVLLAQTFLPSMIKRRYGVFIGVTSMGTTPYLGAHEVFKTAQSELMKTLAAELAGSGVVALNVNPGHVPTTPGAASAWTQLTAIFERSEKELPLRQEPAVSVEVGGAGLAAAAALAADLHGEEITSGQALRLIGIIAN